MLQQEITPKTVQAGFTLIELVMVIVILGILAAVAIPKFVDMSGEAAQAAVEGVAGGLASASSANYAACKVGSASCTNTTAACTTAVVNSLLQGGLPSGYTVSGDTSFTSGVATCTITGEESKTATFTLLSSS